MGVDSSVSVSSKQLLMGAMRNHGMCKELESRGLSIEPSCLVWSGSEAAVMAVHGEEPSRLDPSIVNSLTTHPPVQSRIVSLLIVQGRNGTRRTIKRQRLTICRPAPRDQAVAGASMTATKLIKFSDATTAGSVSTHLCVCEARCGNKVTWRTASLANHPLNAGKQM